jgi:hypothetical protein
VTAVFPGEDLSVRNPLRHGDGAGVWRSGVIFEVDNEGRRGDRVEAYVVDLGVADIGIEENPVDALVHGKMLSSSSPSRARSVSLSGSCFGTPIMLCAIAPET